MKRLAILLCVAMILSVLTLGASAVEIDATSKAYRATTAPVIDGKIDDVWKKTDKQVIDCSDPANDLVSAYTQIMWDDTGYYFLAVVEDPSITENDTEARNSVDLWVSETNTYMDNFTSDDGDWHFCKASDGSEVYFIGNASVYVMATSAVALTADGYIVELYVPHMSAQAPKLGNIMGYTVSINDDKDGDGVRDAWATWATSSASGEYWAKTEALCDVVLCDENGNVPETEELTYAPETTEPVEETAAPATTAPATEATTDATTEAPKEGGCGSLIGSTPVLFVLLLGSAALVSKKH